MENRKIVLPELRFKGSEETDMSLKVELAQEGRHIVEGDRTVILSQSEQYDTERQKSDKYRLTGIIRPIWKNLTNLSTDNVEILHNLFFVNEAIESIINETEDNTPSDLDLTEMIGKIPMKEMTFIRNDYNGTVESDGFSDSMGDNEITNYTWYKDGKGFGSVFSDRINWNLFLTYPSEKFVPIEGDLMEINLREDEGTMSFDITKGLPFKVTESEGSYYEFYSPYKHGLTKDDFVEIDGVVYSVDIIGNEKYRSENKYFGIYKGQFVDGLVLDEGNFRRVIEKNNPEETTSEYYFIKHKILKTHSAFELQKNAFESSIFEDEKYIQKYGLDDNGVPSYEEQGIIRTQENGNTFMYILKDEVDVEGLSDHLDRPLTKLNVSTIHRNNMKMFNQQHYGFENQFGYGNEDSLLNVDETLYNGNDKVVKDLLIGDTIMGGLYEYNPYDMMERKVSDRYLRLSFNEDFFDSKTINGIIYPNGPEGYYYSPHFEYQIREYSDYIEESETSNIYNLPSYAKYFVKEKVWKWRDIWSKGYINPEGLGVDYPFMNGCHYINKVNNFYIKPDSLDGVTNNNRVEETRINPFLIDDCE